MASPNIRPEERSSIRARRARRLAVLDALSTERAMGKSRQRARREMAIRCRSLLT